MTKKSSGIGRRRAAAKADLAPNYEKRREEIYEAAARVFNRKGFSGTTVSAVAKELSEAAESKGSNKPSEGKPSEGKPSEG